MSSDLNLAEKWYCSRFQLFKSSVSIFFKRTQENLMKFLVSQSFSVGDLSSVPKADGFGRSKVLFF